MGIAACTLAILGMAAPAWAQCPDAHAALDQMALAESVDGDCHEVLRLAQAALQCMDGGDVLRDAVNYRRAMCLYALGEQASALRLLDEISTATKRSPMAARRADRLLTLLDTRRSIAAMPFEPDLNTVPMALVTQDPGAHTLSSESIPGQGPALMWRTLVRPDDADYLTLPVSTTLEGASLKLAIASRHLPAALYVYLVLDDGRRYLAPPIEVNPEDGWRAVNQRLSEFTLYPGGGAGKTPDLSRVRYLMIQDATGFVYDVRGKHEILIQGLRIGP